MKHKKICLDHSRATIKTIILMLVLALPLIGCQKKSDNLSGLEGGGAGAVDKTVRDEVLKQDGPIEITAWTPTSDPAIVPAHGNTTFGVTLKPGAGPNVKFSYLINGVAKTDSEGTVNKDNSLQPFFAVDSADFAAGDNELTIHAENSKSKADHVFKVHLNALPAFTDPVPATNGGTVSCGGGMLTLTANVADPDNDPVSFKWLVNDKIMNDALDSTTVDGKAKAFFSPSCALAGTATITLLANDGLDTATMSWSLTVVDPSVNNLARVQIIDFSPVTNPTTVSFSSQTTFAVSIAPNAGTVTYTFKLDGRQVQVSDASYYAIGGGALEVGSHTLRVVASNGFSNDFHEFNLVRNAPPVITQATPAAAGSIVSCDHDTQTFSVTASDANTSDTLTYTWSLDSSTVPGSLAVSSITAGSQASFTPTCAHDKGAHSIGVTVSDGRDTTSYLWSVLVQDPQARVQIVSWNPTTSPTTVSLSTQTTFSVNIAAGAGAVTYVFKLDGQLVQSSTSSNYSLNGGALDVGSHTVRVVASNSFSEDYREFTVVRNAPPVITQATPAAAGTIISCDHDVQDFTVGASDANTTDTLTYAWTMDSSSILNGITTAAITGGHKATFTPTCARDKGAHSMGVSVSDGRDTTTFLWTILVIDPQATVQIVDWSPRSSPTALTAAASATFAVSIAPGAGTVTYVFKTDGHVNQASEASYYTLTGGSLEAGAHTIRVDASNSFSSAYHEFSVVRTAPPVIVQASPAAAGTIVNCRATGQTFTVGASDPYSTDPLTYNWSLDNSSVLTGVTVSPITGGSQAAYTPTCSGDKGAHTIGVTASNGHELTLYLWSFMVIDPTETVDGPISIVDYTPHDPNTPLTVMTASSTTTFAISLSSTAGNGVTYTYTLDNDAPLAVSSSPFYDLGADFVAAGSHTFTITASNHSSTAPNSQSKVFNLLKNTPPTLAEPISPPIASVVAIDCGTAVTQVFSVTGSDADSQSITYSWRLNGGGSSKLVPSVPTPSQATLSVDCSLEGSNSVSVTASDGYETTTKAWTVNINNTLVAAVTNCSPTTVCNATSGVPYWLNSNQFVSLAIAAEGKMPLTYQWYMDNISISGATNAGYDLSGSSISSGAHTVKVIVTDGNNHTAQRLYYLQRNAPPVVFSPVPSTASTLKVNYQKTLTFAYTVSDANDATTSLTPTGLLDGATASSYFSNQQVDAQGNTTITFQPDSTLITTGPQHTIRLQVTDPHGETAYQEWTIVVNNFSNACNELSAGQICTLVGNPSIGDGADLRSQNSQMRIQPHSVLDDGSGNLFIADVTNYVIWFYNRSGSPIIRWGTTIPAYSAKVILGTGAPDPNGADPLGSQAKNVPIPTNNPYLNMAFDSVSGALYVTDWNWGRVMRVLSNGITQRVFGGGGNNTAGNTDGAVGTLHVCANPAVLVSDSANDTVYVSCYGSHSIKKFTHASDPVLSNILGYTIVGAMNTAGASTASSEDGISGMGCVFTPSNTCLATAPATNARTNGPWGLALDARKNLYFTEYSGCRLRVVNQTASTYTYMNGTITALAGKVTSLAGTYNTGTPNTCVSIAAGAALPLANITYQNPRSVALLTDGTSPAAPSTANISGFFVSSTPGHRVVYVNNISSPPSQTIGGLTIAALQGGVVVGTAGSGFNSDGLTGINTSLTNPAGLNFSADGTRLYFADMGNYRVRALSIGAGTVSTIVGSGTLPSGASGTAAQPAATALLNTPKLMTVMGTGASKQLIFENNVNATDTNSIRQVNLATGWTSWVVGYNLTGVAGSAGEDVAPLSTRLYYMYGIFGNENTLYWADTQDSTAANTPCQLKAWNRTSGAANLYGTSVAANSIRTIAGSYTGGCGVWAGSGYDNQPGPTVKLSNPRGLDVDSNGMYLVSYSSHCIQQLGATGLMNPYVGLCDTSGTPSEPSTNAALRLLNPMAVRVDPANPGNLFVLDRWGSGPMKIRYVNKSDVVPKPTVPVPTSVSFYQDSIAPSPLTISSGYTASVETVTGNVSDLWVSATHFCYVNNSVHYLLCRNRRSGVSKTVGTLPGRPLGTIDQEGILATSAKLYGPYGVTVDDEGNLYISENGNHLIRMIKGPWLP